MINRISKKFYCVQTLFILLVLLSLSVLSEIVEAQESGLEESVHQLAVDIAKQMKKRNVRKIAIDDFTDLNGYKSALGDFISEELVTNFYSEGMGNFDVVERRELARIVKEQKLGSTGLLNKQSIAKIGKILGVEAIVTGSIAYLGNSIKINARMIGVENAKVFAAAARKISKDATIEELINQSSRSSFTSGSTGIQSQRFDSYFQNKFLRVEPKTINRSKDKKRLIITLTFRNISKNEIYIALESSVGLYRRKVNVLLDCHNGSSVSFPKFIGIRHVWTGNIKEGYSALESGAESVVILTFESKNTIECETFSLVAEMMQHSGQGDKRFHFTVGIQNLKL